MNRKVNNRKPKSKTTEPMEAALKYLEYRPRSIREVERHLDDCHYGEVEVMETVQRLEELNLLNDFAYAEDFVTTRLQTRPVSKAHLKEQMLSHELRPEAIEAALEKLSDGDEAQNALSVAEKYDRQLSALPDDERRDKLIKRLLARGYGYELVKTTLAQLGESAEQE